MLNKIPFLKKKETIDIEDVKELIEQTDNDVESEIASAVETEEQHDEPEQKKGLFHIPDKAKSNKEIRELILAVEQVAYQYQSSEHKIQELDNRVIFTTSQVTEQQAENRRLQLALENRDRIIEELEEKMMDKNLQFDQVMEDFKETKSQLTDEIEELKSIVNIEQNKFDAQLEKTGQEMLRWFNKVKEQEEKILVLESQNKNYMEKNEQLTKENKYLLAMVNDFTNRMSATFLDQKQLKEVKGTETDTET